jgi:hypothetical protein
VNQEADQINSLNRSLKSLVTAQNRNLFRISQACTNDRKEKATAAVRKDFEDNLREMGRTGLDTNLRDYCTASFTSPDYLTIHGIGGQKKTLGFPDH